MNYRDALELSKKYPNCFRFTPSNWNGNSNGMEVYQAYRYDNLTKKNEIKEMYKHFYKESYDNIR